MIGRCTFVVERRRSTGNPQKAVLTRFKEFAPLAALEISELDGIELR
jgi:hypothetical protein